MNQCRSWLIKARLDKGWSVQDLAVRVWAKDQAVMAWEQGKPLSAWWRRRLRAAFKENP